VTRLRAGRSAFDSRQVKRKGKFVSVLFLNWAQRHEVVLGEWRYSSTHSLTSTLDGGEWSASRPGRFTPTERVTVTHWVGGWVGTRVVLDVVAKRKIHSPHRFPAGAGGSFSATVPRPVLGTTQKSQTWGTMVLGNGYRWSTQRSGNSLSRKTQTRLKTWGGEPCNWKTFCARTWPGTLFSVLSIADSFPDSSQICKSVIFASGALDYICVKHLCANYTRQSTYLLTYLLVLFFPTGT
jgi:hypothetical protein